MKGMTIKAALFKLRAFIALIFIFTFFAFTADAFLSSTNLIILTKHVAINAILAIGMTFVILTAGIDLSVGSIVGLCGMISGLLYDKECLEETYSITQNWTNDDRLYLYENVRCTRIFSNLHLIQLCSSCNCFQIHGSYECYNVLRRTTTW